VGGRRIGEPTTLKDFLTRGVGGGNVWRGGGERTGESSRHSSGGGGAQSSLQQVRCARFEEKAANQIRPREDSRVEG
jgi:hypothetical protein